MAKAAQKKSRTAKKGSRSVRGKASESETAKKKPTTARKSRAKSAPKSASKPAAKTAAKKPAAKKPAAKRTAAKKAPAKKAPAKKASAKKSTRKAPAKKAANGKKRTQSKDPSRTVSFLFYQTVERLDAAKHAGFGLTSMISFDFAKPANSLPVNGVEFIPAARHYPVIFNSDDDAMPLIVLGVRSKENLFVGKDGVWGEGCYIPAFVRRYPFILLSHQESDEIALCVDGESELIEENSERPLFNDGKPSQLMQNVARFCSAYAREQNRTREFVAALKQHDLLISRAADLTLPDGQKVGMRGFKVVDESKFKNLPPATVQDWWKRGWIQWITAHNLSLGNFGRLYFRAKQ